MTQRLPRDSTARPHNVPASRIILGGAALSAAVYAVLGTSGDLRSRAPFYLAAHAVLLAIMVAVWLRLRARTAGEEQDGAVLRGVLGAALVFRLLASLGTPALSDDVYRYIWDGRVQLHGVHPYAHAPADEALVELRDDDFDRINHSSLKTIYPPLAQVVFLLLAGLGAGATGFKLAAGLADFGVVLVLAILLKRLALPRDRLVLYAWNPLAVMETAGSGHIEPLGALLVLAATLWIIGRRFGLSTLALAAAVHVKLLPALLIPGYLKRLRLVHVALLAAVLVGLLLPYAVTGPALGAGTLDYAERWERNSVAYAGVRTLLEWVDVTPSLKRLIAWLQSRVGEGRVDWDFLYRHAWPRDLAKLVLLAGLLAWIVLINRRPDLDAARETFLVLAAAILVSPTLHPWYLLWVLPFAAAYLSWPWLVFAMLVPISYLAGEAEVSWALRAAQYLPPLILALGSFVRRRREGAAIE